MKYINGFVKPYDYLCNFYYAPFFIDDEKYDTVEHYFQAMKSIDAAVREQIRTARSPSVAKKLGRACQLREDWEQIKDSVMRRAIFEKFLPGTELADKLLATGAACLIEGNDWKDSYWGVPFTGVGMNRLGELLMEHRETLSSFAGKDINELPIQIRVDKPRPTC